MEQLKSFIKRNIKMLLIILAVGFLIIYNVEMYKEKAESQKKQEVAEYNLTVANDTIRIIRDREGKSEVNKKAYLTRIQDLEKLNKGLSDEVKAVKGNVSTVIKTEIKIVEKVVPLEVEAKIGSTGDVMAKFKFDTIYSLGNYKKIAGWTLVNLKTGVATGEKQIDEIGIKFTTGIKNLDKNKPEIFLKSDYPGLQVTSLEGAVLDPNLFKSKTKTPLITPTLSIGYTPLIWNTKNQQVKLLPNNFGVTVGLGFNLFKLTGIKK
jgi:hypothetical protein